MKESEVKQDRPAATLDDLVALVEKAARTITQLRSDIALRDQRIGALEQAEAEASKDAAQWREMLKLVRQHGTINLTLNQADGNAAASDPPLDERPG